MLMPKVTQSNQKKTNKTSTSNTKQPKREIKITRNQSSQKWVIKRRTSDLTLSKASATAIAAQANHTRHANLNRKSISSNSINNADSSKKIPIRVWIFFGCSLLLFSISFYQAVIRPQLEVEIINPSHEEIDMNEETNIGSKNEESSETKDSAWVQSLNNVTSDNAVIAAIQTFFVHLSNRDFDKSFDLLIPALQRSSEIREHFTAFRMIPFLGWIEWWTLSPYNFQYISTSTYWRDKYSFNLSYTLLSNQEKYDETWEFVVDTKWDTPKITSIACTTPKCSYHPIFRPENFGMMR